MSRAAAKLADGDASLALPIEKEALAFLQRAFSKSRYILRTLGARERLDLSRRLTGVLAALGRDDRPAAEAPPNPRADTLRRILSDLAGMPASALESAEGAARMSVLAQRTLQVDATSSSIRDTANKVAALANAISAGRGAGDHSRSARRRGRGPGDARAVGIARRFRAGHAGWSRRSGGRPGRFAAQWSAQTMKTGAWRIAAWAIAVAGVIDPSMTLTRPMKPEVALVADRRLPDPRLIDTRRRRAAVEIHGDSRAVTRCGRDCLDWLSDAAGRCARNRTRLRGRAGAAHSLRSHCFHPSGAPCAIASKKPDRGSSAYGRRAWQDSDRHVAPPGRGCRSGETDSDRRRYDGEPRGSSLSRPPPASSP